MNSAGIKNEGWLYWLAFLLALSLRFIQLGASPLTDSEATLALQALGIARGGSPLLAPHPAYILFTSVSFAIAESTNLLARFIPALAGSALVFAPGYFREKTKPLAAVILAFLIAFDPGLVALSRQANGTILAVTFLTFAVAMWFSQQKIPAGLFAGLALLSGPSLWAGILSLALVWIFLQGSRSSAKETLNPIESQEPAHSSLPVQVTNSDSRPFAAALIASFLLAGTMLFIVPSGLSAALASIPVYFSGWITASLTTPSRILITFLGYEPLGILLAVFAIIRGLRTKGRKLIRLALWLGISLLLAVFYRQPGELVWAILPLLTLASLELSYAFDLHREEYVEVGVVVLAILILLIYIWFTISNLALNPFNQFSAVLPIIGQVQNPQLVVVVSALAILVVCITLVALGWSPRIARLGTTFSLTAVIGLYSVGAAWGASGLRNPNGFELWTSDSKPLQADLLLASVDDLSEFSLGHPQSQPVTIMGISSPALEWTLRNHQVETVTALDPQVAPPIVITPVMNDLGLPSAYRGQDFTWRTQPQWQGVQTIDWLKWLVFRQLPTENETIILWARDDLFPDARPSGQP